MVLSGPIVGVVFPPFAFVNSLGRPPPSAEMSHVSPKISAKLSFGNVNGKDGKILVNQKKWEETEKGLRDRRGSFEVVGVFFLRKILVNMEG